MDNVTDLLYLFLVLIRVTSLVLELHHQLLDLLLQPPVGLGPQHPLLGLRRQLLLQVTNLGLQGSCKVTIFSKISFIFLDDKQTIGIQVVK